MEIVISISVTIAECEVRSSSRAAPISAAPRMACSFHASGSIRSTPKPSNAIRANALRKILIRGSTSAVLGPNSLMHVPPRQLKAGDDAYVKAYPRLLALRMDELLHAVNHFAFNSPMIGFETKSMYLFDLQY